MPTIHQYTEEGDEDEKSIKFCPDEKKVYETKLNEKEVEEPINHENIIIDVMIDTLQTNVKSNLKSKIIDKALNLIRIRY